MRVYWDLHTRSAEGAGQMRLSTAVVDREGTAIVGVETETMIVPGAERHRLHACQKGRVIYDYTMWFARRDHSCATSTIRN